jgi:hypothetical protein
MSEDDYIKRCEKYLAGQCTPETHPSLRRNPGYSSLILNFTRQKDVVLLSF